MSDKYILIKESELIDWIKYIERFPLYPEDKEELQSILQQGEEYNENEAIEFLLWYETSQMVADWHKKNRSRFEPKMDKNMTSIYKEGYQELYKLYKNARNS